MRAQLLAILVFLCSCSGPPPPPRPVFYGDSIGVQLSGSVHAPDFDYVVRGGLRISELEHIDASYRVIYLELGTNIDFTGVERENDEIQLLHLIAGIEHKVICVLPMTVGGEFPYMRAMMREHCSRIIDPIQAGVYPLHPDGIHLLGSRNIEDYARLFK